mgnify:CR=1 FL=1
MPVAAALTGGSILGSVLSARSQKKAAQGAADAQTQAAQMGVEEQRRQFDAIQELLSPYVSAGAQGLSGQQNLLGLNGNQQQIDAINNIKNSGQFQEFNRQGQDAILQNAAATGGLRGGNVQGALAQFSPQLLQNMIQQQYANFGGLSTLGQNSAAMTGTAGQNSANQIGALLNQQGAAQAGGILARGQADQQMINGLGQAMGGAARIFGGGFGGMGGF